MVKTTADLVAYAKSLDTRASAMLDADVLPLVQDAIRNLSSQATCFYKNQTIPLAQYVNAGIYTININPQEEVIDYYNIQVIKTDTGELLTLPIVFERTNDKNLIVKLPSNTYDLTNVSISISYFYYLDVVSGGSYTIEAEIYKLMIDCINIRMWHHFKDYEKATLHENYLKSHLQTKVLYMPEEIQDLPLKAGFL